MRRRNLMALAALAPGVARAQAPAPVALWTAGPGSAFLPYGEGLARHLARAGIATEVKQSAGSLQNLGVVEDDANAIGTAFLGSVWDALEGAPNAGGRRHIAIRALFPMYETAFMVAAPAASGLRSIRDLAGKRVGAGPARGPAEGFFRVAAAVAGIEPVIVSGDPAALAEALLRGEIDALWQGAAVPIPVPLTGSHTVVGEFGATTMSAVSGGSVTETGPSTLRFNWAASGLSVELNSFTGTETSSPGAMNRGQLASSSRGDVTVRAC